MEHVLAGTVPSNVINVNVVDVYLHECVNICASNKSWMAKECIDDDDAGYVDLLSFLHPHVSLFSVKVNGEWWL